MSKIFVSTNILIIIFVSICKVISQSESVEFAKNGKFHSKGVIITFSKSTLPSPSSYRPTYRKTMFEHFNFTIFCAITAENMSKSIQKSAYKNLEHLHLSLLLQNRTRKCDKEIDFIIFLIFHISITYVHLYILYQTYYMLQTFNL